MTLTQPPGRTADGSPLSPTERRAVSSLAIDQMATVDLLALINREDATVPFAVREVLPQLAQLVDEAVSAVEAGGSIHYFGAGTSGRFGVLDAAEVPPTFGVPDLFFAHLAGGAAAMTAAVEDAEDSEEAGAAEARHSVGRGDVVFGLAASGHTGYVMGAVRAARELGARTVAVTSNPAAVLAAEADVHLCIPTGPEVLTGSTRMKAGTAQKLVLHSFSTALMVRLGHTYSNLMVDVVPSNAKLRRRVLNMLRLASGAPDEVVEDALERSGGDTRLALVLLLTGEEDPADARSRLAAAGGSVRRVTGAGHRSVSPGRELALGVDIGASGFRMRLHGGSDPEIRGDARPRIGADGLRLDAVVEAVAAELDAIRRLGRIAEVGVGYAGGGYFPGGAEQLVMTLAQLTGADLVVAMPDSTAAYIGALGFQPGAVLAAGTGSVAVASDLEALWRRVDGLGHLLGDRGSGAWLGRRALEVAVEPSAGRSGRSPALEAALGRRFGSVAELVDSVYGSTERAAVLASFAPDVMAVARDGDAVARQLVEEAAEELSETLAAAASGIPGPWSAVGGLVRPGGLLRELLDERLAARGIVLEEPRDSPAAGASLIARSLGDGTLPSLVAEHVTAIYRR